LPIIAKHNIIKNFINLFSLYYYMNKRGFGIITITIVVLAVIGGVVVFNSVNDKALFAPRGKSVGSDKVLGTGPTHLECVNYQCKKVSGNGSNECSPQGSACGCTETDNGDDPLNYGCNTFYNETNGNVTTICDYCSGSIFLYEYVCTNGGVGTTGHNCVTDYGPGSTCEDGECVPPQANETRLICQNEQCVEVQGNGTDDCSVDSDCVEALPNLNISGLEITFDFNNNTNMTATVANGGDATAGSSDTSFVVYAVVIEGEENVWTSSIPAGQSREATASFDLDSGTYRVNVTADINDEVEESNENDNTLSPVEFTVP
jgi:hypothetical protein